MALEQLVQVLRQGTEAEAAAILANARTEAEAIRVRSDAELAERRGAVLAAREAERRAAIELALADARRAARREVLEARQRLLDRVFAAAQARFPAALEAGEYRAALPAQVAEAVACLADRKGTMRCHPAIHQDLKRLAAKHAGLRLVSDQEVGAGFKLASDDGAVEIDGTLEDRLTRLASRVAVEVVTRLEAAP
jgi:vacuolar-type H+-ATPase subunit E/Vma4